MKREGQVQQQYKQVKYRTRKKLLDKCLRVEPGNCCFHAPVSVEKNAAVVLCAYKEMMVVEDWDVVVCDNEQAKRCAHFTPAATAEEIKSRFETFLAYAETSGNAQAIGTIAYHYPDLAALLWVLEPWHFQGETPAEGCGCATGGSCGCTTGSVCSGGCTPGECGCQDSFVDVTNPGASSVPSVPASGVSSVVAQFTSMVTELPTTVLPLAQNVEAETSQPAVSEILAVVVPAPATEESPSEVVTESSVQVEADTSGGESEEAEEDTSSEDITPDKIENDADVEHPVVISAAALRKLDLQYLHWGGVLVPFSSAGWWILAMTIAALFFVLYRSFFGWFG